MEQKIFINDKLKHQISQRITEAKIRESLNVETIFESALIAAFQVHGVLIESNSIQPPPPRSPEKDILSSFFEIIIDMVIQAAAGKIIKSGLKYIMRPVLLSREAYLFKLITEKTDPNPPLEIHLDKNQIENVIAKASKQMSDDELKPGSIGHKLLHDIPKKFLTETINKHVKSQLSKEDVKAFSMLQKKKTHLSPLVEILLQAQENKYRQSAAIEFMYNGLEAKLNYSDIEKDTGKVWIDFLEENISLYKEDEVGIIGRELTLWHEFSIWAFTYQPEKVRKGKKLGKTPKRLTGMGYNKSSILNDAISDMRNYVVLSPDDEKRVVYTAPDVIEKNGLKKVDILEITIDIPKYILDYLVNHFISKNNNPEEKSYYDQKNDFYRRDENMKNQKTDHEDFYTHREHRILIAAYDELLKEFDIWWIKMKTSKKRLMLQKK